MFTFILARIPMACPVIVRGENAGYSYRCFILVHISSPSGHRWQQHAGTHTGAAFSYRSAHSLAFQFPSVSTLPHSHRFPFHTAKRGGEAPKHSPPAVTLPHWLATPRCLPMLPCCTALPCYLAALPCLAILPRCLGVLLCHSAVLSCHAVLPCYTTF